MANFKSLGIPPGGNEFGGVEVVRIAIVDNDLRMSLIRGFEQPEAWGRLAADLVKHVSQIYAAESKFNKADAAKRILETFAKEMAMDSPDAPASIQARN